MQNLLLLHGALGAVDQFEALKPMLQTQFVVHVLNFEGHGDAPDAQRPFRAEHLAANVLAYLDAHEIAQSHVFGYSLGGFVALTLAQTQPQRVGRIATLGTKFGWTRDAATKEVGMLDPQKILAKVPKFAEMLAKRHRTLGWQAMLTRTAECMHYFGEMGGLTPAQVATLPHAVRVMIGDRDSTADIVDSLGIYRALPQGEFEVLPRTPHPFEKVPLKRLSVALLDYFLLN